MNDERGKSQKAAGYSWILTPVFISYVSRSIIRLSLLFLFIFYAIFPSVNRRNSSGRQKDARHSQKVIAPGNAKAWKLHVSSPPRILPLSDCASRGVRLPLRADACNVCTRIPRRTRVLKLPSVTRLRDEHGRAHRSIDRAVGYAVWPREEIKADNVYSEGSPRRRIPARRWIIPDVFLDIAFSIQRRIAVVWRSGGKKRA